MINHSEITMLYQEIKVALSSKLGSQGYLFVHEEYHDPVFDSRYIIWSNNEEAVRFVWDGKESWFRLEITNVLPLSAKTPWSEIMIKPYDPVKDNSNYRNSIVGEIVGSLSGD